MKQDIHFGECPIASQEGYHAMVTCYLTQVTRLDGVEITQNDEIVAIAQRNEHVRVCVCFSSHL